MLLLPSRTRGAARFLTPRSKDVGFCAMMQIREQSNSGPYQRARFPHRWQAEALKTRPLILPQRHFVYPREVEEIERGALEVLVRPDGGDVQPFLATCALGFRDPAAPTGIWATPNADEICAVAGGYAYLIDTTAPEQFTMIPFRPVLSVLPALEAGLLLFAGHHSILAWGLGGLAWNSEEATPMKA